eukprot:4294822-Karenia_brevis.AAC.1
MQPGNIQLQRLSVWLKTERLFLESWQTPLLPVERQHLFSKLLDALHLLMPVYCPNLSWDLVCLPRCQPPGHYGSPHHQ